MEARGAQKKAERRKVEFRHQATVVAGPGPGLRVERCYTESGADPYATFEWETRSAIIANDKGEPVFEQHGVEVPRPWSQTATNIVASKYFRGTLGTPEREHSARQLIGRVVNTITGWGRRQGYFASEADGDAFQAELSHLLLSQKASFNSPVWFNCGIEPHPQCSACFINSVSDTMESILTLAKTEGMLFKYGSGTGSNLSTLRSSREGLATGGTASGPVSFMKGYDAFAGVIKSGGKTRRAAKMVILNVDHPDIVDFIDCKAREEKKAWALIDAGYDGSFNGEAYGSIFFQNSNNSVRVTDEFMKAVLEDREWRTRAVRDGAVVDTHRARDLMRQIAEAAHVCGDPGMQFDSTINAWHTCPATGRINASNPCSEYMFLDDTACNLASLNLMKFRDEEGELDVAGFRHAVRVLITAQEIIVDNASYPTPAIERNSHDYRPLGLGFANLGALLMARGLPYDTDAGREYAAAITALMTGEAYATSAQIARAMGPFAGFEQNREPMLGVIVKHREHCARIDPAQVPLTLLSAARESWDQAHEWGSQWGIRNSQATVLAPTGTIGFMMDCDTTGVEPDIALIKYKKLVGGGMIKIVNQTVPLALERLGYDARQIQEITEYLDEHDTIEGAPHLKDEHLPVFDCAFRPFKGTRSIHYMGHIRMMGAVQPFISGAISKTVNLPRDASPEEVGRAYMDAWKLGLKAIAVYRDGCKRTQPLNTSRTPGRTPAAERSEPQVVEVYRPSRRKLPAERHAITHKFDVAGHEGYLTVGMYDDKMPGEIFLVMAKEGSTVSGLMDAFATAISLALQYGVPLQALVDKFSHMRFEPAGFTKNPEIPVAKSIMDYIFRWLAGKFLGAEAKSAVGLQERAEAGAAPVAAGEAEARPEPAAAPEVAGLSRQAPAGEAVRIAGGSGSPGSAVPAGFQLQDDAPPCYYCGAIMLRNGACYKCLNCGSTSGCS
jgi:ribonucleoside-diphosphate reductase alpha chain